MKVRTKITLGLMGAGMTREQARDMVQELITETDEAAFKKYYDAGWADGYAQAESDHK